MPSLFKSNRYTALFCALLASTGGLTPLQSAAQTPAAYPNHAIRFVVPYPPGGPTDLMARLLQPELQTRLGVDRKSVV